MGTIKNDIALLEFKCLLQGMVNAFFAWALIEDIFISVSIEFN